MDAKHSARLSLMSGLDVGQDVVGAEAQTGLGVRVTDMLFWIDDPDIRNTHRDVIVGPAQHSGHPVLSGQHFNTEKWREIENWRKRHPSEGDTDIRNSIAGRAHLNALFRKYTQIHRFG